MLLSVEMVVWKGSRRGPRLGRWSAGCGGSCERVSGGQSDGKKMDSWAIARGEWARCLLLL